MPAPYFPSTNPKPPEDHEVGPTLRMAPKGTKVEILAELTGDQSWYPVKVSLREHSDTGWMRVATVGAALSTSYIAPDPTPAPFVLAPTPTPYYYPKHPLPLIIPKAPAPERSVAERRERARTVQPEPTPRRWLTDWESGRTILKQYDIRTKKARKKLEQKYDREIDRLESQRRELQQKLDTMDSEK